MMMIDYMFNSIVSIIIVIIVLSLLLLHPCRATLANDLKTGYGDPESPQQEGEQQEELTCSAAVWQS